MLVALAVCGVVALVLAAIVLAPAAGRRAAELRDWVAESRAHSEEVAAYDPGRERRA